MWSVKKFVGLALASLLLAGCSGNRELVGKWTAVDATNAPRGLERLDVPDESHINMTDGNVATYEILPGNNVKVKFPNGDAFTYSYSRSGEDLTLLDVKKKTVYMRDQ